MPQLLTRRGARELTETIDRIASVVQAHPDLLGIDPRIALDFAKRCDTISDLVEGTASINYPRQAAEGDMADAAQLAEDADPASDDQNKPDAFNGKKALDEEGLSVESPSDGWDPNLIGDVVTGPLEHDADEPYMATFDAVESHQLGDMVESGQLGKAMKFAQSLEGAERRMLASGSDRLSQQVNMISDLANKSEELRAQVDAAVDPLLSGGELPADVKKAHTEIQKGFTSHLTTIEGALAGFKKQLIDARAKLKSAEAKGQADMLSFETNSLIGAMDDLLSISASALSDIEKQLRLAFQGFELEQRALGGRTASDKEAGLADLLARFQNLLLKGWRKMVQVADNASGLVKRQSKNCDAALKIYTQAVGDLMSGKLASQQASDKFAGFNLVD